MKNLKYITLAFIAVIGLTSLTSCEDEDKLRFPELSNGGFVKFVEAPVFEAGADPTSASFNAMTEDPNGTVATFDLSVSGDFDGTSGDTIPFRSTTTFPFDVSFTGADMASLFGVDISTFEEGDSFEFFGTATTVDGVVYDFQTTALIDTDGDGTPDTWNGGNSDQVLLSAAGLLSAFNYEVEFVDPDEE
ncbi:MAG TPA: hypothetical protein EYN07_02805 [Flavobacteriaceae bacterium]|jgi:hypothetical protein|nr:hypothetical protein [Flavobacteriaceae bacterium]MAY53863.1 hypothetical protein [Flavobacteriaceae bacterium]HBR54932.1 hypothetical protein [Flavobacteriaceae bacterium]HIB49587.1 hypothetical protein [Flavobacteriaceae bacterium]HIN98149.1 hypothetical protein [Flavobacteriaceae bacterium]|tara:strand:+ start:21104 stop:21673 length:570 start_codon:yes stop_codon:yes gene_type:complete